VQNRAAKKNQKIEIIMKKSRPNNKIRRKAGVIFHEKPSTNRTEDEKK
jgi:hypothetical protein